MAITTSLKGLTEPQVSGDAGSWGTELNTTISALDTLLGYSLTLASSAYSGSATLTSSQAQSRRITLTGTLSSTFSLILPATAYAYGDYFINNATTGSSSTLYNVICATTDSTGATVSIPANGQNYHIYSDGINVTAAAAPNMLMQASGTGHGPGLAPDPGSTAGATHFLREDATWALPPGTLGIQGSFQALKISVTSTTAISVAAGMVMLFDGTNFWLVENLSATINTGTSGAGGLDTGSMASNQWYYVWAIEDTATQTANAMISLSSSSPTMPAGYTAMALIGVVRASSSAQLMQTIQYGRRVQYVQTGSGVNLSIPYVQTSSESWAAMSLSAIVPPIASEITVYTFPRLNLNWAIAPNGNYLPFWQSGSAGPPPIMIASTAGIGFGFTATMVLESQYIYGICEEGETITSYILNFVLNL